MKFSESAAADRAQFGITAWQHWALLACMFLTTGAGGFVQPFVSLYLDAAGLKHGQIGLVLGCSMATALIIQPLLGHLSDRIDARRPLMFGAGVLAAIAYSCYGAAQGVVVFTLLTVLAVNGFQYLNAGGAVVVARMAHGSSQGGAAQTGTTYARYRVWGSVGFIVVTLLCGALLQGRFSGESQFERSDLQAILPLAPVSSRCRSDLLPVARPQNRTRRKASTRTARREAASESALVPGRRYSVTCSPSPALFLLSLYMKSLGALP
jgi:PPP family 3-phenylpropionic acid transporter